MIRARVLVEQVLRYGCTHFDQWGINNLIPPYDAV